jgi:hypothetical protein
MGCWQLQNPRLRDLKGIFYFPDYFKPIFSGLKFDDVSNHSYINLS